MSSRHGLHVFRYQQAQRSTYFSMDAQPRLVVHASRRRERDQAPLHLNPLIYWLESRTSSSAIA